MPVVPRRRLQPPVGNHPGTFQPGQDARRNLQGRPTGARNRSTNLMVEGITQAIIIYGKQYAEQNGLDPEGFDPTSDVGAFTAFMLYVIEKDLRGFLSIAKGLIPKDVRLNIQTTQAVELIPPQQLRSILNERGLHIPETFRLTSTRDSDDDGITEADIVASIEGPPR